jgi:hemerythrin
MLQRFTWTEALSTGSLMVDIQHKELIAAINDLADAIEQGKGATTIKKLLTFLKYYAEWHFGNEEKCVAHLQCPLAETNKQAHCQFIEMVHDMTDAYRNQGDSETIAREIHSLLSQWLVNHIMKIDSNLFPKVSTAPV